MFSAMHVTPITLSLCPLATNACITPKVVAEPCMSYFISSIEGGGLSEIPPVSNVIPFPTIHGLGPGMSGLISNITMHGFLAEPIPTPTRPPIPMESACS